jgi:hypothetical protein
VPTTITEDTVREFAIPLGLVDIKVCAVNARMAQASGSDDKHMKLSMRYGLVGIGALSALSLVHWVRKQDLDAPEIVLYLIGVLPNVAAAIAIPFVLLSIWADQKPAATYRAARQSFAILTLVAGVGLIAWEFMQQSSRSLFFDYDDIAATIFGLVVAWLLFLALTPAANAAAD